MIYNFSGGVELEVILERNTSIPDVQSEFNRRNIKGWHLKVDGSVRNGMEAASMPFADCQTARDSIAEVCDALNDMGCTIDVKCGLHVHIGNAPLNDNVSPDQYTRDSIEKMSRTGRVHLDHAEPFDDAVIRDIAIRYTQSASLPNGINAMLSPSRRNNKWARLTPVARLQECTTIKEMEIASQIGRTTYCRKYSAINFKAWSERGTIEFRQHQGSIEVEKIWNWFLFITDLYKQTLNNRFSSGTQTTVTDTPAIAPFRAGGRIIDQYNLMRQVGGATTRDIMLITGCSETSARRGATEIRDRLERNGFPRSAVIQHDQISNGHQYGDGTDLNGYEIALQVTVQATGAALIPDNQIGNASIWAGVSDDQYAWWQNRIAEHALRG